MKTFNIGSEMFQGSVYLQKVNLYTIFYFKIEYPYTIFYLRVLGKELNELHTWTDCHWNIHVTISPSIN